jgi:hypothetical protein
VLVAGWFICWLVGSLVGWLVVTSIWRKYGYKNESLAGLLQFAL